MNDTDDIIVNPVKEPTTNRSIIFIGIGVVIIIVLILAFLSFDSTGRIKGRACIFSSQCEKGLRCENNICINIDDPSVISYNPNEIGKPQIGNYSKSTIKSCVASISIGKDDTQVFSIGCSGKVWMLDFSSERFIEQTQLGDDYIFIVIEKFDKDNVKDLFLGFIDSKKKGTLRKVDGTNLIEVTNNITELKKVLPISNGNGQSFVLGKKAETEDLNTFEIFEVKNNGTINSEITQDIDEADICTGIQNTLYSLDFFRQLHIAVDLTSSPTRWNKVAPGFISSKIACASETMILFEEFGTKRLFIAQDKQLKLFSNEIQGLITFDIGLDGTIVLGFNDRVELYKAPITPTPITPPSTT